LQGGDLQVAERGVGGLDLTGGGRGQEAAERVMSLMQLWVVGGRHATLLSSRVTAHRCWPAAADTRDWFPRAGAAWLKFGAEGNATGAHPGVLAESLSAALG